MPLPLLLLAGEAQSWKSRATENPGWEGEGASSKACGKCPCISVLVSASYWRRSLETEKNYRFCLSQSGEEMTTLLKQGQETGAASSHQHTYLITFPAMTLAAGEAVSLFWSNSLLCVTLYRRKRHGERKKMPREKLRMISRRRRLCPPWVPHTAAIWLR